MSQIGIANQTRSRRRICHLQQACFVALVSMLIAQAVPVEAQMLNARRLGMGGVVTSDDRGLATSDFLVATASQSAASPAALAAVAG